MTARIPGGAGYVPGQTIYIELVVDNKSDQDVCAFTVQLISVRGIFITCYHTLHAVQYCVN